MSIKENFRHQNLPFNTAIFIFILVLSMSSLFPKESWCSIDPSQVLILYNADWKEDEPLTEPGQDSKEIAEYYVQKHTSAETGEKPYILGLTCRHGVFGGDRHLNAHHLEEDSKDNFSGVEIIKRGWQSDNRFLRDSRIVEFLLPKGIEGWNMDTLQLSIKPGRGPVQDVVINGKSIDDGRIKINHGKDWTIRLNAREFSVGEVTVTVTCENKKGAKNKWEEIFTDIENVKFSRTGKDRVRDDKNFLEDVESPLKSFLENPKNSRQDGTLLKDHILFIVVVYGLPRTAVARYGIKRGITNSRNNFGENIDFGQRIELLYYDEEKAMGINPLPHRFDSKRDDPFNSFYFRAPQAFPLSGRGANPFMHPLVYQKDKKALDDLPEPIQFNQQNRKKFKNKHLYFVMRIDAPEPLQARGLIERSVYASEYAGVNMGVNAKTAVYADKEKGERGFDRKVGKWLWEKGFQHLYKGERGRNRLEFLSLFPDLGFYNSEQVYLPGGIGGTVKSSNSFNNSKSQMLKDLQRGVTATIGAAQTRQGHAPHIHDKSWWDDEILYPFLLRYRTLGEVFLMNQTHLGWISTFVGDPLYRLPLFYVRDEEKPEFNPQTDIKIYLKLDGGFSKDVWLVVNLESKPGSLETAQLKAISQENKDVVNEVFSSRPYVNLGNSEKVCGTTWKVEVVDPYLNSFGSDVLIDCENN